MAFERRNVQFNNSFHDSSSNGVTATTSSTANSKLMHLHENPSLDMSSESECAPEPPPRPALTLSQIKPPPLPPKKQANDLSIKPPPRPPHTEDSHYDYMDNYETAPSSLEFIKNVEKSPPLPVPARKARFETDFTTVPERPKKHFEDDYLTPISLPPPQRSAKKQQDATQVTVASYLESKPNLVTSVADNCPLEGLDITLSQLTLSGLNELATKLNIPTTQLSNMTLVQLTSYLSNFIKSKSNTPPPPSNEFPAFKADFAANFSSSDQTYDRYAVFRELIEEEIKQTKIDTEPEEIQEEKQVEEKQKIVAEPPQPLPPAPIDNSNDRYAALREIVESELKINDNDNIKDQDVEEEGENGEEPCEETNDNIVDLENKLNSDDLKEKEVTPKYLIEYNAPLDNEKQQQGNVSPKSLNTIKSPVPIAITEIIQNNARLTSGSLSDVVSGSSPEVDNTASNSDVGKGKGGDAAGESWAIFDQGQMVVKDKQPVQSEEGVSPWSSDSKEFGNGSPPDWRRGDSGSGGDHWPKRRTARRDQEGWWDTSAEPDTQYYQANRRSTDSYEEEYYECYERPRRRKQPAYTHGSQAAGGHSSSSRDVSPWEEEPRRRDQRPGWPRHPRQHSFEKHSRDRRHTDSWDDEDDYEYEDEHVGRFHRSERHAREVDRERHSAGSREHDVDRWGDDGWSDDRRHRRKRDGERDRRCCQDCDQSEHDKHSSRYGSSGRYSNVDGPPGMWRERKHDDRYYSRESQESPWEDEYSNEADDVHSTSSHYLTAKRNWKRPSSASEMDRKTGEIKSRHYLGTGGSDGERDRRYKPGRRSRSRDSQYSEPAHRHKPEPGAAMRNPHRGLSKPYSKSQFEGCEVPFVRGEAKLIVDGPKPDHGIKKSSTLTDRKKPKDNLKTEENTVSTFPRKSKTKPFENDFSESGASPRAKLNFENDLETSEAESPTIMNKSLRGLRQQSMFEKTQLSLDGDFKETYRQRSLKESRLSPHFQSKPKSLFEDDFSPSDRPDPLPEDNSISSIKEEMDPHGEEEDSFNSTGFENNNATTNSRKNKKLNKHRLSNSMMQDVNIKKSESVNIFARENDPFDDDFFSENAAGGILDEASSPRTTDLRWTDDFRDFDIEDRK